MAPMSPTFLGGLLMGMASSLHCAGMCGPLASSLLIALDPGLGPASRARVHFTAQAGRIFIYLVSGALLGGAGAALYGAFDHASAYMALRWAGAVALGWIGLTVAGFAPSLAGVDALAAPVTGALHRLRVASGGGEAAAFLSGMIWGFLPCGMVYGALFYAMLAGSALGGASVMFGFGLGALPAVSAVALGMAGFRNLGRSHKARISLGLAIVALAAVSVALPAGAIAALCGFGG